MIKLQIVGNLGADCMLKEVNGKNVINFNVAHTERFKDSQGVLKERTTWVNCAYWTDRTAVAQYLKKGKQVYVEGWPEAEAFTNKENQPAAIIKLRVRDLQLLGGNTDEGQSNNSGSYSSSSPSSSLGNSNYNTSSQSTKPVTAEMEEPADDLPF
jgi:single-strand DNA-binding protein